MRRIFLRNRYLLLFSNLAIAGIASAQEIDNDFFPTPNTRIDAKPDPKKQKEKEKKIRYIVTNDTKNTLPGNLCFEEVTMKMGFLYLAVPKGQPPNKNNFSRWWHNFGVKFMILLKNGPFWKTKVNKKYKKCKYGSGDFMG